MPNVTSVHITAGIPDAGTGSVSTLDALMADGGQATLGAKTDAAASNTDTTAISIVQVLKQVSKSVQSVASTIASTITVQGTVSAAQSGTWTVSAGSVSQGAAPWLQNLADGTTSTTKARVSSVAPSSTDPALVVAVPDFAFVPFGGRTDSANSTTDGTAISAVSVWKQVSKSVQSLVANITALGRAAMTASVPVIHAGYEYETVAASQTAQVLGATGGTGDMIFGVLVIPATTSPGNVIILDNATSITIFTGGASSITNLVPFFIPLNLTSVSGAWKLTTGANVSCIGIGDFT